MLKIVDTGYIYESTKGDQGQLSEVTKPKGMWNSRGLSRLKHGTVRAAGVVRESNQIVFYLASHASVTLMPQWSLVLMLRCH